MSTKIKYTFLVIALLYVWAFFAFKWTAHEGEGWKQVISSDGKGYYAYLPSIFIEGSLNYTEHDHLFTVPTENGFINRYYCGTALLQIPTFLIAHAVAHIAGYETNGYSEPYALMSGVSALVYFLLGLYMVYRLLKEKFLLSDSLLIWCVLLTALGSNLMYYTVIKGSFSHVYSFFLISAFFYGVHRLSKEVSYKTLFFTSLLLGMIVVTRPVNLMVILLVPAFFSSLSDFLKFVKSLLTLRRVVVLGSFVFLPVFLQFYFWYLQTGSWFLWSYKQEGFYFDHPRMGEVLFGFRRGLFVYTPLFILSIVGIYYWFKESKFSAGWALLFFALFTFVTASWWNWTYGDSYSLRPFTDVTLFFSMGLGYLLARAKAKKIIFSVAVLFTLLQNVYAYQYYAGISDITTMTQDKFLTLFLKTSGSYKDYFGGIDDIPPFAPNGFDTIHKYVETYDEFPAGHRDTRGELWLGGTEFTYPQEKHYVRHLWIEVTYRYKITHPHDMGEVLYAFHSFPPDSDSTKAYFTFRAKEYPTEKTYTWLTAHHKIWFPNSVDGNDRIKLYFWNRGEEHFLLDDYTITVMVPK